MLEIRYYVGPVQYGRGSSRSIFDNVLGRLSRRNRRWTTSADRGAGHWRTELEESYPVMGLTSLEVESDPSYAGLKFRSRGRLLTNFLERSPASSNFRELSQSSSNFLQSSQTFSNLLQHSSTFFNLLQPAPTFFNLLQPSSTFFNLLQHTSTFPTLLATESRGRYP